MGRLQRNYHIQRQIDSVACEKCYKMFQKWHLGAEYTFFFVYLETKVCSSYMFTPLNIYYYGLAMSAAKRSRIESQWEAAGGYFYILNQPSC